MSLTILHSGIGIVIGKISALGPIIVIISLSNFNESFSHCLVCSLGSKTLTLPEIFLK